MAYATLADLVAYLGPDREPPADADRLLERASELIDEAALYRIDPANPEHAEAARKATCAQVEHWLEAGETEAAGVTGDVALGSLRMSVPGALAPRARRALLAAGLLSRAVRLCR